MPRAQLTRCGGRAGLLAGLVLWFGWAAAHAGGVVSSCTEAAFRSALSQGGTVSFSNDCTITLSQQVLVDQASTTIDGSGHNVILSGGGSVPLLRVATNLVLRGLTLTSGKSTNSGASLFVQPGVTVIASQCAFAANSVTGANGLAGASAATNSSNFGASGGAGTPGASALGGAIYNLGTIALVNCVLTNNTAVGGAGGTGGNGGNGTGTFAVAGNGGDGAVGGAGFGGAVYNLGDLTLINCSFSGNSVAGGAGGAGGTAGAGSFSAAPGNGGSGGAAAGGAVFNANNLTVIASTFSTNSALAGNSATAGQNGNGTGQAGLQGATASGGALYNQWWAAITNCTFYTNTVIGGTGGNGGVGGGTFAVPGEGGEGGNGVGGSIDNVNTMTIVNCTFSSGGAFGGTNGIAGTGNFTADNGSPGIAEGGNFANSAGVFTLMNSILTASASGANTFGSFIDGGHNLSSDSAASFGGTSRQNTSPLLGPLTANGGPTLTMALLANSPALDQIPPAEGPATDQRGYPRPANGLSDIGAFELGAAALSTNATLSIFPTSLGQVQLNGTGTTGLVYTVQASTNLATWQSISTNTFPFQFTDPTTNFPARYYRLSF